MVVDMVAGAYAIGGSGQGDIILSSGGKKKSKKIVIIIAVILAVVLLGTGAAVFLINNMSKSGNSYFDDLKKYIEVGNGKNEKGDLIYAVSISNESNDIIRDYYRELVEKEEAFFNSTNINNDVISEYKIGLKVLRNAIDYVEVGNELIDNYNIDNNMSALDYVGNYLSCGDSGSVLDMICAIELYYYTSIIEEYVLYVGAGCYNDGFYDGACIERKYGTDVSLTYMNDLNYPGYYLTKISSNNVKVLLSELIEKMNSDVEKVLNDN